jgi:uncharacterized membrane protein
MYSKARVAGHPIHPMLVAFPIAFYTATVALLLAYVGTREAFWYRVAMIANLAGIVTAVIAVIPGAIDLFSLPASSRARAAGLKHAGFNLLATGLYAVTAFLLYRSWNHRVMIDGEYLFDATIPLAMSVVAWVSMVIAGSLGWTLVQTHHVGIKPAMVHPDRPSREPELDDVGTGHPVGVPGARAPIARTAIDPRDLRDTLDETGRHRATPGGGPARPSMRH